MIEQLKNSASGNFFLLAGPCVIEGEQMAMDIAGQIVEITRRRFTFRRAFHAGQIGKNRR